MSYLDHPVFWFPKSLIASLIAKGLLAEADLAPEYLDRKALRDAVRADLLPPGR